jgi:hypothetical protein
MGNHALDAGKCGCALWFLAVLEGSCGAALQGRSKYPGSFKQQEACVF